MYGKIFQEIFDSSLMFNGGWKSVYVFSALVILADQHGMVHHDERALFRRLGLEADPDVEFDEFTEILAILAMPDQYSNLPGHEGKRIIHLSEVKDHEGDRGYWIVNYEHYKQKASKANRQEQNRAAKRRQRGQGKDDK